MIVNFCKYFFGYVVKAKTRQHLLCIAIFGIILSSFSLLVLQSTMQGLQSKLINRSKEVVGNGKIIINNFSDKLDSDILFFLKSLKLKAYSELEAEVLARNGSYLTPIIIHGVNINDPNLPKVIKNTNFSELILPEDIAFKLHLTSGDKISLISPAKVNFLLGEIPQIISAFLDESIKTDVPQVDSFHGWIRKSLLQNLLKTKEVNRIYYFGDAPNLKQKLYERYGDKITHLSWEEQNKTLLWALKLEATIMLFLFSAMSLLVSLCTISGLSIFLKKVQLDMTSFWILGCSNYKLHTASIVFIILISIISALIGLLLGYVFLVIFKNYSGNIMPDIFIDRKIPVQITSMAIFISFVIPSLVSIVFSIIIFLKNKNDEADPQQRLSLLRSAF